MKNSPRSFRSIIIWILSLGILVLFIFYMAERGKYAAEQEKVEMTTMYFYELEVENPLLSISYFIGVHPFKIVEWEEQEVQEELISLLSELDDGLYLMDSPSLEGVPANFHKEIQTIKKTTYTMLENLQQLDTIDEKTKQELMNFSKGIDSCEVRRFNSNLEQIVSELECLNKTMLAAYNK